MKKPQFLGLFCEVERRIILRKRGLKSSGQSYDEALFF